MAILLLVFAAACTREEPSGWYIDSAFTTRLVSFWDEQSPIITREDPATYIDALQIFRTSADTKGIFTINEIRSQQLIYETVNTSVIKKFFDAARRRTNERCEKVGADFRYYILAFDRQLLRVGLIKYFPCVQSDLGFYQRWGSNSAYFSSELSRIMKEVIPPRLEKKKSTTLKGAG